MDKIIAVTGVVCAFGIVLLLSIGDISNDTKLPIVALFMLIAGYSLTRIRPKESKSEKIAKPSAVAAYAQEREITHG